MVYKPKTTYVKEMKCTHTYVEECKPSYNYEKVQDILIIDFSMLNHFVIYLLQKDFEIGNHSVLTLLDPTYILSA